MYDQTPHTPTQQAKIIAYIPTWRKKEEFNYANGEMYQYITHGIVTFLMISELFSKTIHDLTNFQGAA